MATGRAAVGVLVVGQLPPPVHGQSLALRALVDSNSTWLRLRHLPMRFSRSESELGRASLRKLVHLVQLTLRTIRALRTEPSVLYYPPAPPRWVPVLRDLVFLSIVRRFACGTVFHFHAGGLGEWIEARRFLHPLARRAYGRANLAIHVGPSVPNDGAALGADRIVVIPNGIADPLAPTVAKDPGELVMLFVGLHCEGKGIHRALDVLSRVRRLGVPARLETIGHWSSVRERDRAQRTVRAQGLEAQVRFRGAQEGEAKWRLFANADLLLFPTKHYAETQGLVVVEAMAMGLPVVASDWRGPRDVVIDGETGSLHDPDDTASMARAVEALWDDPDLARSQSAAGRARFEKHYRLDIHLAAMRRALQSVLG